MLGRAFQLILVVLVLKVGSFGASASASQGEFLITKWTTEEGLPQNTVTSIVQTSDGYIWLGTFGGLARFDGVKFTIFDTTNSPGLASNRVLSLYEDRWKRLWIGTETGEIYTLVNGKFIEHQSEAEFQRKTVWEFIEDNNGRFYIASDSGLERLDFREDGSVIPESVKIISRQRCFKLAKGPDNTIWTSSGRAFLVEGDQLLRADALGRPLPTNILAIDFDSDGRMLIQTTSAVGWFEEGEFSPIRSAKDGVSLGGCTPAFRQNDLWCQEGSRLHEIKDGKTIIHDLGEFVTTGSRAVFFDNENNIWLATETDGLVRLTRRKISLVGDLTDLDVWGRYSIAEDSTGAVWLSAHDLLKVRGDNVEKVNISTPSGGPELITAVAFDGNNVLWAGGLAGLYAVNDRKVTFKRSFGPHRINSLFFDRQATLWIGTAEGIWHLKDGEYTHFTTNDGLSGNSVHFITQTKDETIWIGTIGGVSKFKDGKFENITPENGLSGNYVREILEDSDGTMWIGTYGGGINRLRSGKLEAITTANGLHDNFVSRILIDDANRFWILGNLGIFAVSRDDLNAVADIAKNSLIGSVFGVADGMKSSEASGGHQPAGIRTRDGRLWFPMIKDVVIIDPAKTDRWAPRISIESAFTRSEEPGSQPVAADLGGSNSISIPTGQRDLEIRFTGLSFTRPEKIRFYYKLDGLDDDWTDAGTRRSAIYPYLPGGNYTFQVRAVNASGIMSENTAVLAIAVDKYVWQTPEFTVASLFALSMVGIVGYRLRMRQLESRRLKQVEFSRQLLNAQESERGRIATELHDGLGQNLLIIKNWAQLGLDASDDPGEVQEHLKHISETAAQSLDETRTIVRNLSPQNLRRFGLTEAIVNMIDQIENATGVVFQRNIENIDGLFPEEAELSIFRIVQECLNNIIKHSESPTPRNYTAEKWKEITDKTSAIPLLFQRGAVGVILVGNGRELYKHDFIVDQTGRRNIATLQKSKERAQVPILFFGDAARAKLFEGSGMTVGEAMDDASDLEFRPMDLKPSIKVHLRAKQTQANSHNVVGYIEGSDPVLKNEAIAFTAHYDGFGMVNGKIYNAAADNAIGNGEMLAVAEAFSKMKVKPKRSLIFISTTAEEYGLQGGYFFAQNPKWDITKIAANLNLDGIGTEIMGPIKNMVGFGAEYSSLGAMFNEVARSYNITPMDDPIPEQGVFGRSDHYPFVTRGVPALMLVGSPEATKERFVRRFNEFEETKYHQPTDDVYKEWHWPGAKTVADMMGILGYRIAQSPTAPTWLPGNKYSDLKRGDTLP